MGESARPHRGGAGTRSARPGPLARGLDRIEREVGAVDQLIDGLLTYARLDAGRTSPGAHRTAGPSGRHPRDGRIRSAEAQHRRDAHDRPVAGERLPRGPLVAPARLRQFPAERHPLHARGRLDRTSCGPRPPAPSRSSLRRPGARHPGGRIGAGLQPLRARHARSDSAPGSAWASRSRGASSSSTAGASGGKPHRPLGAHRAHDAPHGALSAIPFPDDVAREESRATFSRFSAAKSESPRTTLQPASSRGDPLRRRGVPGSRMVEPIPNSTKKGNSP